MASYAWSASATAVNVPLVSPHVLAQNRFRREAAPVRKADLARGARTAFQVEALVVKLGLARGPRVQPPRRVVAIRLQRLSAEAHAVRS